MSRLRGIVAVGLLWIGWGLAVVGLRLMPKERR